MRILARVRLGFFLQSNIRPRCSATPISLRTLVHLAAMTYNEAILYKGASIDEVVQSAQRALSPPRKNPTALTPLVSSGK